MNIIEDNTKIYTYLEQGTTVPSFDSYFNSKYRTGLS